MRIVAGQFRGRAIASPADGAIRPTSDRVREALFNVLAHGLADFQLEGARVIDLFCGTGAFGLEALSRGASTCLFIDTDASARALVRQSVEAFGLTGTTRIYRRDATDLGPLGRGGAMTLGFLDPPYGKGLAGPALASLLGGGWLAAGAIVVVEERAGETLALPPGLVAIDTRTYGDTQLLLARAA